ncbi:MAG: hypothetical protein JO256_04470 [Alphaproteobacteria bacterium]|nr:hypothetical protein [Alphaproteobacteria bacterium]
MPSTGIWVELTDGNVRNDHIYLRDVLSFFPANAVGGSNETSAASSTISVEFSPGERVETDIDGDKLILRKRGPVRDFFSRSGAKGGDVVLITKLSDTEFKFELAKR